MYVKIKDLESNNNTIISLDHILAMNVNGKLAYVKLWGDSPHNWYTVDKKTYERLVKLLDNNYMVADLTIDYSTKEVGNNE